MISCLRVDARLTKSKMSSNERLARHGLLRSAHKRDGGVTEEERQQVMLLV